MKPNQGELFPQDNGPPNGATVESLWPTGFELTRDFLNEAQCKAALAELTASIPWKQESILMYGKLVPVPRLTAWFGDPGADYVYSGVRNRPEPWTPLLLHLRDRVNEQCKATFNSVLLNLYRDGADSVAWHADDEPELGPLPTITSLSLGATRRFRLRDRESGKTCAWDLAAGELLTMCGRSQRDWEHCVSKTKRAVGPRVNLTFRRVHG